MRITGLLATLLISMMAATQVAAKDLSIKAFSGLWEGNAVSQSNTSVNFPITSRDLDVHIKPESDTRFVITWRTLQRQKGDPNQPKTEVKETTRTYQKEADGSIWREVGGGDPFAGGALSWASLDGQALTIYSMAVRKKGGYDMLVYKRTLTGLNMKLDFKAIRDGNLRRTAGGTLIKTSN
ncbi:hypothetical protein GUA87_15105 [Sneathiella sp. P13V-1]|uniref:hypothetical protein n=1 Tax=Sneathiella sp. P13V-1 TaxID=2697366 RepID=UPI00187B55F7|nr:hypothetical protein [Sneathiella sp. P13V-1]MBE7638185.1 hypothetical protein [Sneathiella sp. P13V-1]